MTRTTGFEHKIGWPDLNDQENVEKIYASVERLLEADFDGLYAYFDAIRNAKFDYVVLMSRRCLVLYQLFATFLEYDKKPVNEKQVILSDKALPFYWEKIDSGSNIAIVDDIIVHGRAVCEIYGRMKALDKGLRIKIFSYMADQDMECISEDIADDLEVSYIASTNEWRKLSNKIVDCIFASNVPYTSFVTSFFQYKEPTLLSSIKKISGLKIIENSDVSQNFQKVHSYFVYEENGNRPAVFSLVSLGECIRCIGIIIRIS